MIRVSCLLLVVLVAAHADEVVLKSGGRLGCEIIATTTETVTVRLPHGTMVIPRSRIASIVREERGSYLKREARSSLRAGSTRSAVDLYERAHREHPDDAEARAQLVVALHAHAQSLVARFRLTEAEATLARLGALEPGHVGARALLVRIGEERTRAAGLVARARTLLEKRDYERALVCLDAWRVRRPVDDATARKAMADAHIGAGRQAGERGALRSALDHFRAARAYGAAALVTEALYLLRPIAVLEELREGDVKGARRLLDGIATTYPDPAVPILLRAVMHHVGGEVEEAVAAYAESARVASRRGKPSTGCSYELVRQYATATLRAAIARPPQEGVKKWRELFLGALRRSESRHFVVFAPTEKQAATIAEAADKHYATIARELLGRVPSAPRAEIVLHPGRESYLAADPDPPGSPLRGVTLDRGQTQGLCYDTLDERGRPVVRIEMFAGQPGLMVDTLPHELVHVVQRRGLAVFRRGKWLDEGLAMLFESEDGQKNRRALWRTLAAGRIPLPELLTLKSIPPGKAGLFYQQSHALAAYLRGIGDADAWREFLDVYGRGDFASALRQAYDVESVDAFERMWVEHLGAGR